MFKAPNNQERFHTLLRTFHSGSRSKDKIKVGLEAADHYYYTIL